MRQSICSWRPNGATLAALIMLAPASAPGQVRPVVTVEVRIDGRLYRQMLADTACTQRCDALRSSLRDSVRARFQRRFSFLDWRAVPAAAPDTVVVTWDNPDGLDGVLSLAVAGQHGARPNRGYPIQFEAFADIYRRSRSTWQSAALVEQAWLARLDDLLAKRSELQGIVRNVLVKVPLRPVVDLNAMPTAVVRLSPRAIRANPDTSPTFLVRMTLIDPDGVPLPQARQDVTEVSLYQCGPSGDRSSYFCRVEHLVYTATTPQIMIENRDSLQALARRTRRLLATLHLNTFVAADPLATQPQRPR